MRDFFYLVTVEVNGKNRTFTGNVELNGHEDAQDTYYAIMSDVHETIAGELDVTADHRSLIRFARESVGAVLNYHKEPMETP